MRRIKAGIENCRTGWLMLGVFLIAFLPRVFLCMQTVPVRTLSDELATISGAAYFAGLDWSSVISNAGYYGSGFSALFAPVFWITDNPFVLYKLMLIGASVFQSLIAPISYHLMKKYFKIDKKLFLIPASLACSFMVVTRTTIFYNEHMLIFISWLAAWLLCILTQTADRWKKRGYTLLMMLLLGYSLTIHTRALTYWIAFAVVIVLYYWVYRKWLVSKIAFLAGGAGAYVLGQKFVELVQNGIWLAGDQAIRNQEINIPIPTDIFRLETWQAWISIIVGQLNTISAVTGGFILLCIIAAFCVIWQAVLKRKGNPLYVTVLVFFTLCCGATIAAQSFSWLGGVVGGIQDGFGTKLYGMKAVTYVRYFGPYAGPVFLCGLTYLMENRKQIRPCLKAMAIAYGTITVIWVCMILPYIKDSFTTMEVYMAFAASKLKEADILKYAAGTIVPLAVFLLLLFLVKKKKWNLVPALLALVLMYQYAYGACYFDVAHAWNSIKYANGGYTFVQKLEEGKEEVPQTLYVVDRRDKKDHFTYYEYQILLNRYKIVPGIPEETENTIVFCNRKGDRELIDAGYRYTKLDKNEYLYVKGNAMEQLVTDQGKHLKNDKIT